MSRVIRCAEVLLYQPSNDLLNFHVVDIYKKTEFVQESKLVRRLLGQIICVHYTNGPSVLLLIHQSYEQILFFWQNWSAQLAKSVLLRLTW